MYYMFAIISVVHLHNVILRIDVNLWFAKALLRKPKNDDVLIDRSVPFEAPPTLNFPTKEAERPSRRIVWQSTGWESLTCSTANSNEVSTDGKDELEWQMQS